MSRLAHIALLVSLLPACIGVSPEQQEQNAQGPYDDGDEFHRPGQPCLTCHREGYAPGDDEFLLAGTVYLRAADANGVEGIEVVIVDGLDREIVATTNRVGNFFVKHGDGDEDRRGRTSVRFDPVPPYQIRVREPGGAEQVMESLVWREGSCAACHTLDGPHESSVGRVFVTEVP
jgi:mono/diheme cytochrome c family protein